MVFTSLPLYLDPPSWNQQNHHHQSGGGNELQSAIQPNPGNGGDHNGSVGRPGSMADRARLAKIPQPEPALKCPRCDSTNTKFCYFNNYSLTQPRHFCKTCRRYWTRGGALRSVPVGGGCRRNKRSSKSKSNNSNPAAERQAGGTSSSSTSTATSGSSVIPFNFHHLPFFTNLHPLSEIGVSNFHGIQQIDHAVNYQVGGPESIGLDQWRIQQLQQFPFLDSSSAAVMTPTGPVSGIYNYPFDGCDQPTSSSLITQLASVKMEDSNPHGLNLQARQYLGISGNDQYWGGGGGTGGSWAPGDLSGFNSTSSGNIL